MLLLKRESLIHHQLHLNNQHEKVIRRAIILDHLLFIESRRQSQTTTTVTYSPSKPSDFYLELKGLNDIINVLVSSL